MTLSSQASRPNAGRKYMVSRRRRARRWPWVVVLALAGGLLWVFQPWSGGSGDDGDASGNATATASKAVASTDSGGDGSRPGGEVDAPPGRDVERRPPPPSFTLSRDGVSDSASRPTQRDATAPRSTGSSSASPSPTNNAPRSGKLTRVDPGLATSPASAGGAFRRGRDLIADRNFVEGRRVLSALLFDPNRRLNVADAQAIRDMLTSVNQQLVFGPEVQPGDPLAEYYLVQRGDLLARIAPQYKVPYQFLERINDTDARRLQAGKPIKVVKGPFHARVVKRDYRMDVFLRAPDGSPIYVKSYPVGLGQDDSTPVGLWRIAPGKKVKNPDWRNPRTGEYFKSDDPDNPIGEYWLALEGIDDDTRGVPGYGIHGTVDPGSIGDQASMGCIRLRDNDIEEVFAMFVGGDTTVEILP